MMDVQVEAREFPVFETWDALWAYLRIAPVGAMADLRLPDAKMPEEWLRELWDDAGFPANGWGSTASALRTAWAADDAEYRRRERNLLNLAIITKAELLYRGKPVDGPPRCELTMTSGSSVMIASPIASPLRAMPGPDDEVTPSCPA